jgi:hypothetical protein
VRQEIATCELDVVPALVRANRRADAVALRDAIEAGVP